MENKGKCAGFYRVNCSSQPVLYMSMVLVVYTCKYIKVRFIAHLEKATWPRTANEIYPKKAGFVELKAPLVGGVMVILRFSLNIR